MSILLERDAILRRHLMRSGLLPAFRAPGKFTKKTPILQVKLIELLSFVLTVCVY